MKVLRSVGSASLVCAVLLGCHSAPTAEAAPEQGWGPPRGGSTAPAPPAAAPARVGSDPGRVNEVARGAPLTPTGSNQLAAFAAGCFWGVEDAFRHVKGVTATAVGFTGGHTTDPDYPKVCTHTTGHAETVLVEFDPTRVPYEQLLRVFFKIHDPTEVDRQGPDVGDQYRSEIFTFSPEQASAARAAKAAEEKAAGERFATKVEPIGAFYRAEDYHQQYAEKTGSHGCPVRVDVNTL
jgi:peptide-methionine (S)-S-oxide reductase